MQTKYYDLIIIGSGPGGYVAAIRAAQLGLKTAVIEKDRPGGVCLNIGCIPTKSLIHQANQFVAAQKLKDIGITLDTSGFKYENVVNNARQAAENLSTGVRSLLKKNGVELIMGIAQLKGPKLIALKNGNEFQAAKIIIATGSRPRSIPGFDIDEKTVLSSTGALFLKTLPKRLLVLGGGAIGVEFAHIFQSFGTEVAIAEMLSRLLPSADKEAAMVLERSFKKRGIFIHTNAKALSMKKTKDGLKIELDIKGTHQDIVTDAVLVAVGRSPNTEELRLETAGIQTGKGFISVGDYYQTMTPSIYAVGDIINTPQLAHLASREGEIAAAHIAGQHTIKKINPDRIPYAVYCEPQVAGFGLTEEDATEKHIEIKKAIFPYRGSGKAFVLNTLEGWAKVLYDPTTGEILGVHIVGSEATELIHELLLAKTAELLPEDIVNTVHAHPTLSEINMEVMRTIMGKAIHT